MAGNGASGFSGDGGPATAASLAGPVGVAVGADGSVYIADFGPNRIRRVGADGIITTVAGNGTIGFSGDGGPATTASLHFPTSVALAPDGSLYFVDSVNLRIRRVGLDGIITTVAGNGTIGSSGDGGPATAASLALPVGVAVGTDGSLYIADTGSGRIRRVGADGIITTVAGNGTYGFSGDGGSATAASLAGPGGVAVSADGSVYFADSGNNRVRRVGPDGIITTVAGNGSGGFSGDGGLATAASLNNPSGIAVGGDGSLYIGVAGIANSGNSRIRQIKPDGIITTVTGTDGILPLFRGDGGPATVASLRGPSGIAVSDYRGLYIADSANNRIRLVHSPLPGFSATDIAIPSPDGTELYHFDATGRHLATLDTLTGAVRYQFAYDSAERLRSVTDGDGNVTTIERSADGNPTALVSPYGQRTTLAVDANGYLSQVTNPAGEAIQLGSTTEGLLTSFTDARGNTHRFTYDSQGLLTRDEDPTGGVQALTRTGTDQSYTVNLRTALGRMTSYQVQSLSTGDQKLVDIAPDGTQTVELRGTDGSDGTTLLDGTVINRLCLPFVDGRKDGYCGAGRRS